MHKTRETFKIEINHTQPLKIRLLTLRIKNTFTHAEDKNTFTHVEDKNTFTHVEEKIRLLTLKR